MQLGARWRVGDTPHRGVPPQLHGAIAEQEAAYPTASAWTLTFLEGRPRCALDDLVIVALTAAGTVTSENLGTPEADDDDDDDWLV